MKTAILLMGHGSRVAEANQALFAIADMVQAQKPDMLVEVAFRELHPPDIQTGIDRCVERGAERVLLYPYFLFLGAHVREDLPAEMTTARRRYPQLLLAIGDPLGVHPKLGEIVCERIDAALAEQAWA